MEQRGAILSISTSLLTFLKLFSISVAFSQPARKKSFGSFSQYLVSGITRLLADDEINKERGACNDFLRAFSSLAVERKYLLSAP